MTRFFDLEYQPPLSNLDKVVDWDRFKKSIEKALKITNQFIWEKSAKEDSRIFQELFV
jgi:hypothetical protein